MCVTVGSLTITVPCWWGMVIIGEVMQVWEHAVYRKSLYLNAQFGCEHKTALKKKIYLKKRTTSPDVLLTMEKRMEIH